MKGNVKMKKIILLVCLVLILASFVLAAPGREIVNFDSGWKFARLDQPGADKPDFNDSKWRVLDLPHDWAIEGFVKEPVTAAAAPEISVVAGEWKFNKGDDLKWKETVLDDSAWQKVKLPAKWEDTSNYTQDNVFGWFRREITIPETMAGKDVIINVGMIDDADETYLNGELIGAGGAFPPNFKSAWNKMREYKVPASMIKPGQKNVLAVRVFDAYGSGGIWAAKAEHLVEGPFDRGADSGSGGGYMAGGTGWYRKTFKADEALNGKKVSIDFDGVYMNSDVWINGTLLGNHPYGYTGFSYDITPYLKFGGADNIMAVRVNVKQPCSRWYSGAGIYRHVRLTAVEPLHVARWGTYLTTSEVSEKQAKIRFDVTVENSGVNETRATVETVIYDPNNSICARATSDGTAGIKEPSKITQEFKVENPALWSPDSPALYRAKTTVMSDGKQVDSYDTVFGIRYFEFTADQGFFLNGKHTRIKGVCLHHDLGYLGTAVNKDALIRQISILKEMGCNAIRTSHNPPAPELLELCDSMGMLVMDEAFDEWKQSKTSFGYGDFFDDWSEKDLTTMLHRDRNHPSIILWSIGNEVIEQWSEDNASASAVAKQLADICRKEDGTRPVTAACNGPDNVIKNGIAGQLDILGINYNISAYSKYKGIKKLFGS